jgi:hypothetical protein
LRPQIAQKLNLVAAQFKEYWVSGCRCSPNGPAPLSQAMQAVIGSEKSTGQNDSLMIAFLRSMESGDETAICALADWLEERRDPRAYAIREITKLEVVVRETRTIRSEERHWVEIVLNGKSSNPWIGWIRLGDSKVPIDQRVRELQRRRQCVEVWQRLGLSVQQREALKQYLGINAVGIETSMEEIAKRAGKQVETIKNRIDSALYRLAVPAPHMRHDR